MMNAKRLFLCWLLAAVGIAATAYNDYRNARVDSLEQALKSSNPPKGDDLLRAYDELMRGYLPYDAEKAKDYGRKALALSYKQNGLRVRQDVLRRFGLLHYSREEHDEAIRYFNLALAVVDSMVHDKRYDEKTIDDCRSCLYGAIGNVYNLQDKHHLAIHYYQLALPIFEKYNWRESQTILYHNIGELYYLMGNFKEAERNYQRSIEKAKESKDSLMIAIAQKGLFRLYVSQDDYKKARQTATPCYGYYQAHRTEETEDYPVVLASLVRLNLMDGHRDIAAAKAYAEEALSLADSLMFENQSEVYTAAAEVAMAERQWQQALGYALKTIRPDSLATSADASCYAMLAEIYTELGNKQQARYYINKVQEVMNRYATDHYQSGLSQMKVLYQTEKKEAQIATLDKERALYRWLLVAAVVAIAALVTGTILIIIVQRRQKALMVAQVALEAETNERRFLARDLHDGLGSILSLIRIKAEKTEVVALVDKAIVELRRTAHHLMPEELLRNGLVSALNDFAVSVPNTTFSVFGDIQTDRNRELVLYRCAYELVNNAMKHAEATHIGIQLMQDGHELVLTVSDDGKGLKTENDGMGLQNIRERISSYKGVIDIITAESQGTEINIKLPL